MHTHFLPKQKKCLYCGETYNVSTGEVGFCSKEHYYKGWRFDWDFRTGNLKIEDLARYGLAK